MTDHVHNQLCQRIEELEKEKLELNEQVDALAAHVERLRKAGNKLDAAKGAERAVAGVRWLRVCGEAPEAGLARLKAQWQAEALEAFGNGWDWERQPNHKDVRQYAEKLRRQAEGGDS